MKKSNNNIYLGALKDKEDKRDYLIKDYIAKVEIPLKLDLSDLMLPVRDQLNEGTCVAFASAAVKESEEPEGVYLSVRNLYEKIKQPGGGAYPRDAMKVLMDYGIPTESCQIYIANRITPVCEKVDELSKPNRIKGYARLYTIDEMKQCLNQHGCFMIAVAVREDWIHSDGYIKNEGILLGYHAITFVGYDDETQLIKFRNSWGEAWGDRGYGYIRYNILEEILTDAWSSIDVPEKEEGKSNPSIEPWWIRLYKWILSLF